MHQLLSPVRAGQTVTYTTSTQSASLGSDTRYVRLVATTDCWIAFGANPTAVAGAAGAILLMANFPEIFGIAGAVKIAVILYASGGKLNITEGIQLD